MVIQVWQVLDAFKPARTAYERVCSLVTTQRDVEIARNVTCILLWLETIEGFSTVLERVGAMPGNSVALSRVIVEADAVHSYVMEGTYWLPPELEHLPTIVALTGADRLIDLRFFKFHRDLVTRGLAMIRSTFAPLIFSDNLNRMLWWFEEQVRTLNRARPAPELMEPFAMGRRTPAADSRTAFISFPEEGQPPSAQEIKGYFERYLGFPDCIERVAVEQLRPLEAHIRQKHGVIVFRSEQQRNQVMCNQIAIFYRVGNDCYMWMQRYQPLC